MQRFNTDSIKQVLVSEKKNNGASFSVKSLRTNNTFVFSISRYSFNDKWYTSVSYGIGNQQFEKLGNYFNGKVYLKKQLNESLPAKSIAWILDKIENDNKTALEEIALYHFGCCVLCGRVLTDTKSIIAGLGPHCRKK